MSQIAKKSFYTYTETPEYERTAELEDLSYYDTIAQSLNKEDLMNIDSKINARVALAEENAFIAGFEYATKIMEAGI